MRTPASTSTAASTPLGILRALAATAGGGRQGASTITQQYVNNVIIESQVACGNADQVKLGSAKTVADKIREMKLAIALEKKYSKDQILEGYLNIVYFDNNVYGIEAAANYYFGVHAKDLTLPAGGHPGRRRQRPRLLRPDHPAAARRRPAEHRAGQNAPAAQDQPGPARRGASRAPSG